MHGMLCYFGIHSWGQWAATAHFVPFRRRFCNYCGKHDLAPSNVRS